MSSHAITLIQACPARLPAIPESRWEAIEAQIHEALQFGADRFILDLTGAHEIRPLDYWMVLNLAILIPAGNLVLVADEEQFTQSLQQSKLTQLLTVVRHLADAYAALTGIAAGPAVLEERTFAEAPSLQVPEA
ncbi:MAG: hypothetical protein GEEBNDBF_01438 [bacterium]|nr:hypothetical protein [bacterium]